MKLATDETSPERPETADGLAARFRALLAHNEPDPDAALDHFAVDAILDMPRGRGAPESRFRRRAAILVAPARRFARTPDL